MYSMGPAHRVSFDTHIKQLALPGIEWVASARSDSWVQIQSAKVEVNRGFEPLLVAEAA